MNQRSLALVALALLAPLLTACGGPKLTQTGFLSNYNNLDKISDKRMEYLASDLPGYSAVIVEPIRIAIDADDIPLSDEQQQDIVAYFHEKLTEMLEEKQFHIVDQPGDHIARVRLAITDIHKSTWWLNLHPGSKLTGAGLGGASMEGEIVDSVTGAQLAAIIQKGKGNQFELDTFSGTDDIKDVINRWVANAGDRIDEMRERRSAIFD